MSPRKAKMAAGGPPMRPQAKPICDVSQQLERIVARWASRGNRGPELVAAVRALSAEIVSLGKQDATILLDRPAIRTARQRLAAAPEGTFSPSDIDRAASIFSSSIMSTLMNPS